MSIGFANAPGPIFKFLLRLHLRRHARSGELDPSQKKAIQDVLADEGSFGEAAQAAFDFAVGCGQGDLLAELEAATGPQKPVGRLLQWLWDNRQQVLQFVLMIVGLFTGGTIPMPKVPAAETPNFATMETKVREVAGPGMSRQEWLESGSAKDECVSNRPSKEAVRPSEEAVVRSRLAVLERSLQNVLASLDTEARLIQQIGDLHVFH